MSTEKRYLVISRWGTVTDYQWKVGEPVALEEAHRQLNEHRQAKRLAYGQEASQPVRTHATWTIFGRVSDADVIRFAAEKAGKAGSA